MAADRRKSSGVKRGDDVWIKIKPYKGEPVRGVVKDVLTKKGSHPRGIKVRLGDGRVGRVVEGASDQADGEAGGAFFGLIAVVACAAGAAFLMRDGGGRP